MLTKEERKAIAERANKAKYSMDPIFEILLGYSSPEYMSLKDDFIAMVTRILDLCDTSNMIELPLDKDGVPFKRGDTVYESDGTEHTVDGYAFAFDDAKILSIINSTDRSCVGIQTDELTHKNPITIASLAKELTDIAAADYDTPMVVKRKISDIADQLEKLGDTDD